MRWVDITHEPTATGTDVNPYQFKSRGWFLAVKEFDKGRGSFVLLTTSIDDQGDHYGVEALPWGCVRALDVLEPVDAVPREKGKT